MRKNDIFICLASGSKQHVGKTALITEDTDFFSGGFMGILRCSEQILPTYLYTLLNVCYKQEIQSLSTGSNINNLSEKKLDLQIPLPPLPIQTDMVAQIEAIDDEIAGLENDFDVSTFFNSVNLEVYNDKIRNHLILNYGSALKSSDRKIGDIPVYGSNGIVGYHSKPLSNIPTVIIGRKGSVGKVHYSEKAFFAIDTTYYVELKDTSRNNIKFIYYFLSMGILEQHRRGLGSGGLNREQAYDLMIPFPPLSTQQKIVEDIETQRKIIEDNKQKIEALNQKKQDIMNELWHDTE